MDTQLNYKNCNSSTELVDEEDDVPLPGFRFHPLDEELVGFYLLRKVQKKPISIELIKEIDLYKYDPWDLPSMNSLLPLLFCIHDTYVCNSILH